MLLSALSTLSFLNPTWGLIALFIVTSTFFHLARRMALPLPIGYVEPIEAVIAVVLLRLLVSRPPRGADTRAAAPQLRSAERLLLSAILPYAVWQTLCSLRGLVIWFGTDHARFAVRFILAGVVPLALPFLLLRTEDSGARVFRAAFWIALAAAAVHLVIQLLDIRSLMQAAYVYSPDYAEYGFVARSQKNAIRSAAIPRLLPQGIVLIALFAIYTAVRYLTPAHPCRDRDNPSRDRQGAEASQFAPSSLLLTAAILTAALASTVTRSLLVTLVCGLAAGLLLTLLPRTSRLSPNSYLLSPTSCRSPRVPPPSCSSPTSYLLPPISCLPLRPLRLCGDHASRRSPTSYLLPPISFRLATALVLLSASALAYNSVRPGFLDFWLQRLNLLSGPDSQIFSEENEARGRDNLASLKVLAAHPFFGIGSYRYPADYSLRRVPPTDIHPVLQVGLVGGIPGILLLFRMYGVLILAPIRLLRRNSNVVPHHAARLVPLVAVLIAGAIVSNLTGAGGAIMSAPLLALMLFVAETTRVMYLRTPDSCRLTPNS